MSPDDETGTLDADKLRELAAWYREFSERAEPTTREARMRIAEQLERDADLLEQKTSAEQLTLFPAAFYSNPMYP
jgi:predicted transposase YdaD